MRAEQRDLHGTWCWHAIARYAQSVENEDVAARAAQAHGGAVTRLLASLSSSSRLPADQRMPSARFAWPSSPRSRLTHGAANRRGAV
jgi:hypothetical protein